jgi:nucleotide-binding universal stress UspA family protein
MNMQAQPLSRWRTGLGNLIARLVGDGVREPESRCPDASTISTGTPGFWSDSSRSTGPKPNEGESPRIDLKSAANILVPVDFSPTSFEAVECALRLARKAKGRLTFLHVVHLNLTPYGPGNPEWLKDALRQEAVTKTEALVNNARAAGVAADCLVEEGVPAAVIADVVARQHAQMLIMAAPTRGLIARFVRRKTIENVIRDVPCPVLVLQSNRKEGIL